MPLNEHGTVKKPFAERYFMPLTEQVDEYTGVMFNLLQFMKPIITPM